MASEVQYVNCKELHNPTFTPQIATSGISISTDDRSQQWQVVSVSHTEPGSSSVKLSALAENLLDHASCEENLPKEQSGLLQESQREASDGQYHDAVAPPVILDPTGEALPNATSEICICPGKDLLVIPEASPSTSLPSTGGLRESLPLPENSLGRQTVVTPGIDHGCDPLPVVAAEQEPAPDVLAGSIVTNDNPETSDQDDDVQFILSVTRKRRRKRQLQSLLPGDQGRGTGIDIEVRKNTSNSAGQETTLGAQTAMLNVAAGQSPSDFDQEIPDAQGHPYSPSMVSGSLLATISSSVATTPTTGGRIPRKRKRKGNNEFSVTPQTFGSTNAETTPITLSRQRIQFPQNAIPSGLLPSMPHMSGAQLAQESQVASGFVDFGRLHGLGPQPPSLAMLAPNSIQAASTSAPISESLRRRPSLYAVPQWKPTLPGSGMAVQTQSANKSRGTHENEYFPRNLGFPGGSPTAPHTAGPRILLPIGGLPRATSQTQILNKPSVTEAPIYWPEPSKQPHPPNMLVDIAQTCQDNFPFALIAKRHNQPIQKVFDTFSAIIQLPLLRSAVDSRRPGRLGSLRMREFRAMKKGTKELPVGVKTRRKVGRKADVTGNGGT